MLFDIYEWFNTLVQDLMLTKFPRETRLVYSVSIYKLLEELIGKSLSVQQQGIATLQNTFNMSQLKAKAIDNSENETEVILIKIYLKLYIN